MKIRMRVSVVVLVLFSLILACNVPGQEVVSEPVVTPNLTMTALFSPPINIATETLTHQKVVTSTGEASKTPSPSPTPTETATPTTSSTVTTLPSWTPQSGGSVYVVTATTAPTSASLTAPCYRSVETFEAPQVSNVWIDGNWAEWGSTQYWAWNVVYGAGSWISVADLGGNFVVGWDSQYLYLGMSVTDERYVQNQDGDGMYKGDSVELLLDVDLCGDFYSTSLSGDDYQIGISPGKPGVNDEEEVFKWYPRPAGGISSISNTATSTFTGGYRVEAAIPWSAFKITDPKAGDTFGFAFSVSDNDDTQEDKQESMVSGVATRHLTNPTTWGTLILK